MGIGRIGLCFALACAGCLDATEGAGQDGDADAGPGGAGDAGPAGGLVDELYVGTGTAVVATTPASDDLFVTGAFTGTINLGDDRTLTAGGPGLDMYVAELSPEGEVVYAMSYGGTGDEEPTSLVVDPVTKEVVTSGLYAGVGNVGGVDFPEAINDVNHMFIAAYDAEGGHRWSHPGTTAMLVQPSGNITLGPSGQAVLGGYFDDTFKLGPAPMLTSIGGHDAFYTTVSNEGVVTEPDHYGAGGLQTATGAVASAIGSRVYLFGVFDTSFSVAGQDLSSESSLDGYVVAMNLQGTDAEWVVPIRGDGDLESLVGAARPDGGLVLAGWFMGRLDLSLPETTTFTAEGRDMVLLSMNPAGDVDWAVQMGGPGDDYTTDVAVGEGGAIWVTGHFDGTASFAGTELESNGVNDIFVARYEADGQLGWVHGFGGLQADAGASVAPGPDGSVYAGVLFRGLVDFGGDELLGSGDGAVQAAVIQLR